jgi:predicted nucleic acid-binding protein
VASLYDSSLLLAGILGQVGGTGLTDLWDKELVRVSSVLLEIECLVALRRLAGESGASDSNAWVAARMDALHPYLEGVTVKFLDEDVISILRGEPRLANCRALDAIHLATALYFQPHLTEPLRICSLDKRMRTVARSLGFPVLPTAD